MKIIADLVHHTGSMIRFTTSQLDYLPNRDELIEVILPDGTKIKCRFHLHKANPYIAGEKIVHWIKGIVPFGEKRKVFVEITSGNKYLVYMVKTFIQDRKTKKLPKNKEDSFKKLLKRLSMLSSQPAKIRRQKYIETFNNRINSNLIKEVFGINCQVENCEYTSNENRVLMNFMSEVHHLEHLASGGTNSPFNLAILCSNHHSILHRDATAKIINLRGDNVQISYFHGKRKKWIIRDLSMLHKI